MSQFKYNPPTEAGNEIDGLEFARQTEEIINSLDAKIDQSVSDLDIKMVESINATKTEIDDTYSKQSDLQSLSQRVDNYASEIETVASRSGLSLVATISTSQEWINPKGTSDVTLVVISASGGGGGGGGRFISGNGKNGGDGGCGEITSLTLPNISNIDIVLGGGGNGGGGGGYRKYGGPTDPGGGYCGGAGSAGGTTIIKANNIIYNIPGASGGGGGAGGATTQGVPNKGLGYYGTTSNAYSPYLYQSETNGKGGAGASSNSTSGARGTDGKPAKIYIYG